MSQPHAAPFEKYHGAGNDFVVLDATHPGVRKIPDRRRFASAVCDRETGVSARKNVDRNRDPGEPGGDPRVGADGVLFLDLSPEFTPSRLVMTLVQPDGSVAAMCGNGARCAAQWAHERTGETEFMIDTMSGTRHASVDPDGQGNGHVEIEMGVPEFDPSVVEREVAGLVVTAVDTGVPHAVAFVDDVGGVDLEAAAPPVRYADVFPDGANVDVASRAPESDVPTFDQRTYERGVEGETRACGTGAVAIAAVARRLGLVDEEAVRLRPPGGDLLVTVPDDGPARLAGPVEWEFDGTVLPGLAEAPRDAPAVEESLDRS